MPATKFYLLAVGARFRYDGRLFTKNAPLTATDEQGSQRMIPRSAVVEPIEAAPRAPAVQNPVRDLLAAAAEDYHRACLGLVGQLAGSTDPDAASRIEAALVSARDDFVHRLDEVLREP